MFSLSSKAPRERCPDQTAHLRSPVCALLEVRYQLMLAFKGAIIVYALSTQT